ncbi:hypothetical protein L227DRAFT_576737 [Lentinus tigrinus ALCF2SS1-6]|uniref:Uncharacterized protein n=1 Tax=Lentinus tigrinus ALCF2SS1-6 TaxID=1328759 RepID=A0A5C2S500_9APHY|nr:hypothetical protein L227DRAFT_576737 [Lentinus tigrinus ALCF2SS1-6]
MPLQNAFLDANSPNVTLLDETGTPYHMTPGQFRLCNDFNRHLREHGTREGFICGVPFAYQELTHQWNLDEGTYQFAVYDVGSDSVTIRGRSIPADLMDEIDPPTPAPAPPVVDLEPQFTAHQTDTINRMLWAAAEREAHFAEARGAAKVKKAEERKRKREEYRASDAAKKTRVDERVGERSASNAAGGSGSPSTSQPKAAGPSKSKSKLKTSKDAEAMDEDKDAEGEAEQDEFELIEYETADEEAGMSKAEGKKRAGTKRA